MPIITPNRLTALRILISLMNPLALIFKRSPSVEILVLIAFSIACVTDWWDGYLARTKSMVTRAGKIADPIADKLLILGLLFTFSYLKFYSFEWVIPIAIREAAVTTVRLVLLAQGKVLPAEWAGKVKVGFQCGSIYATLVLLFGLDSRLFEVFGSVVIGLFTMLHYLGILLANVVTITSGILFFNRLDKND